MAAEGDLILEQALDRGIKYRRWAIGAAALASITIVLALVVAIFFLLWQRDAARDIAQARSEAEKARDEAEVAVKQSREAVQEGSRYGRTRTAVSPDNCYRPPFSDLTARMDCSRWTTGPPGNARRRCLRHIWPGWRHFRYS